MNVWVAMSKGIAAAEDRWQTIVDKAQALVADDAARILLCACSHPELWHRRDRASREGVGRVMRDLTKYATFAPIETIRSMEVDAFVQRHVGRCRTIKYRPSRSRCLPCLRITVRAIQVRRVDRVG